MLRIAIFGLIALFIVSLVFILAWGLSIKQPTSSLSGHAVIDKPAPDFSLKTFEGEDLTLSELYGNPIVINFWASWCFPCRQEARVLEKTWREYRERNISFVGIAVQDSDQGARNHLSEFQITYPNALDQDGRVSVDYGIVGMPATFFVNSVGIIEGRWVGAIPETGLIERLEILVGEQHLPYDLK